MKTSNKIRKILSVIAVVLITVTVFAVGIVIAFAKEILNLITN